MSLEPPRFAPPIIRSSEPFTPPPTSGGKKSKGPLGAIGAALAACGKFLLPALKLLKGGKFLLTGITMFASMWFYSIRFGWGFAAVIVLGILIHELGHVLASAFLGVPVSAPIFLPGFGALIVQKKWALSAWGEALIGIGGPLGGTLAGLVMWGLYFATGNQLFLAAAYFTFLLNLFNMIPVFPLDGGRIVGAISPYIWVVGLVGILGMGLGGYIRNPVIWILVVFSLPHVWNGLKRGTADPVGGQITTKSQRLVMGIAYVTLAAFLFGSMELVVQTIVLDQTEAPRTSQQFA